MVTGTGEEPHRGPGVTAPAQPVQAQPVPAQPAPAQAVPAEAVPTEAVPDAVPPVQGRPGTERVRRPADLLLAIFAFVIVVLVLSTIRTLPLGSTEAADDVSRWLLHIPRWLAYAAAVVAGVASFVLAVVSLVVLVRNQWRDALNAVVAGLAGAAAAVVATVIWRIENATVERAVLHGSNPSIFIVDTAFVAFVVGTDLSRLSHWQRWWPRAGAALLLSGLAVGTLTPFAVVIVASGGLLFGWVVRWLLGAASVLPGITELTSWLTSQHVQATDRRTPGRAGPGWKGSWPTARGSVFTCPAATPADRAWPAGCGRWPASGRRSRVISRSVPAPGSSNSPSPASWRSRPASPVPPSGCSARCPARPWCSSRPSLTAGRKPGRRSSLAPRRCSRRCAACTTPASRTMTCGRATCSCPGTAPASAR